MKRLLRLGAAVLPLWSGGACDVLHGSTTTACTMGAGPSQTCVEVWSNVSTSQANTSAQNDCTNNGGVVSNSCSRDGADGGCKKSSTTSGVEVSTTLWYYSGADDTAAAEASKCAEAGGTLLAP